MHLSVLRLASVLYLLALCCFFPVSAREEKGNNQYFGCTCLVLSVFVVVVVVVVVVARLVSYYSLFSGFHFYHVNLTML